VLRYDFEESIGYWLTLATQALHRAFNEELTPHGVTFRQAQVLFWLVLEGELSQNELAARMEIEPPTLAGVVDRMERAGWIRRRPCEIDRRRKLVSIGPKAEPVWERLVACARRVRARAIDGLSAAEVRTLKKLLGKVHANMSAAELSEAAC